MDGLEGDKFYEWVNSGQKLNKQMGLVRVTQQVGMQVAEAAKNRWLVLMLSPSWQRRAWFKEIYTASAAQDSKHVQTA